MAAPTPKGVNYREPGVFSGNRSETDRFIWEVKNFLKGNHTRFVDEAKRITWLLRLLRGGEAIDWAINWATKNDIAAVQIDTIAGLITVIQTHFKPINEQAEAWHQLKTFK